MNYCLNPACKQPKNPDGNKFCQTCGSKLLLRDHYRALKAIGSSTYSRTFLAVDEDIPSKPFCVIKQFFPPQTVSEAQKAAELFKREAVQLDRLGQHPQIPRLLAYFEQDRCQYLIQEFMEGKTLAEELKQSGAFSEEQIFTFLKQILPLLHFVHSHQVIHRDIKPANIIRRPPVAGENLASEPRSDSLLLVGFSAVKSVANQPQIGNATIIGSPEYTASEQLTGKPTFASDLYSLGVTCIELLTQTSPFNLRHGNNWEWRQYLSRPVSATLGKILDKLLQDKASQRYQSATEVLQDLETLQPREWKAVETFASGSRIRCVAVSPDSQMIASGSEENRIQLWYPGTGKSGEQVGNWLSGHSGWVQTVSFSPDGRVLISGSCDRSLKLWDLGTGKLLRSLGDWFAPHNGWINTIAFHPSGTILVSGSTDMTIKLWNISTGKQLGTLTDHQGTVESVAISPDGKLLASGSGDRTVKLWELPSGKAVATLTGHQDIVRSVSFSPDSQILASGSRDHTLKLWQVNTGELLGNLTHSDWIEAVAFSPQFPLVVGGTRNGAVGFWNPYTEEELTVVQAHSASVTAVVFTPNGKGMISGSADGSIKVWQVASR
ncbi:WD40 repeat domain-containing serine/threonine-protein kinase [Oscillatoria acuminata]|uniref:WD40 repeat-containing protein n=1 Tax=Oscillatoria acuminata PCC 6304 TaxID=56110 RepID=K9TF49_9CYAN|nr:WD40 repeat domain-containing serine/threonine-protein kinase [Oscillatoria acuminata]AFY81038.1 WD40 repeat-containing protein [Oscillatoria acuminata PCC 6304]